MAKELVLTGTATATLVGAWELRAGSMDTTEWLDGAADVAYPGGGPGTFNASNSDGANGYDAAPKMALIALTDAADAETIILTEGTTDTRTPTILSAFVTSGVAAAAQTLGLTISGGTVTLEASGANTGTSQLMVLYD
jgi:hypothetical protein